MVGALVVLTIFGFPATARAVLAISVPPSSNLGATPTGSASKTAQLGTVTVTASGLVLPSFTATVATTVFTTGGGSANETIPKASIAYWSGPATLSSGASTIPGQANTAAAQSLSVPRTAFSATGLVLSITVAWNPTLIVNIPSTAVAGTYTGTITHSVA